VNGPDLFAGIRVSDFDTARAWYERLLGGPPAFLPHDAEAVWELAEHRFLYILESPAGAGASLQTIFEEGDLDARVAEIAGRGLEPAERESYSSGARKAIYRDPDGNEIGLGGPG
jgi:hypothetical protein